MNSNVKKHSFESLENVHINCAHYGYFFFHFYIIEKVHKKYSKEIIVQCTNKSTVKKSGPGKRIVQYLIRSVQKGNLAEKKLSYMYDKSVPESTLKLGKILD